MSVTRKIKIFSLEQKLKVCRLMQIGELFRKIAESCGVEADGDDMVSQIKSINLKDAAIYAWNSILVSTLRASWNKLLGCNGECVNQSTDCDDDFTTLQ
ncbi:hypothetical protein T07_6998 [Trichinella nelsoni]|uniref:Uncharacterized protein n=1 Tax=Trichinella nelsoni TaxID=6336 RepID=A0A0V0S164_9BILA|nr:hypothetical protein T07_6998 [Trichinella nelsoni]